MQKQKAKTTNNNKNITQNKMDNSATEQCLYGSLSDFIERSAMHINSLNTCLFVVAAVAKRQQIHLARRQQPAKHKRTTNALDKPQIPCAVELKEGGRSVVGSKLLGMSLERTSQRQSHKKNIHSNKNENVRLQQQCQQQIKRQLCKRFRHGDNNFPQQQQQQQQEHH